MLNSLNEIIFFSDTSIQIISRNIDNYCLAIALSNESETVRNRVFSNLSKRRLVDVTNALLTQGSVENNKIYVEELKNTINQLIEAGKIILEQDEYELDTNKLKNGNIEKKGIANIDYNSYKELSDLFLKLNYETRIKGFLALEPYLNDIKDVNLRNILQLIIDGCGEKQIDLYLSNMESKTLRTEKMKIDLFKTGIFIIMNGESSLVAKKLLNMV